MVGADDDKGQGKAGMEYLIRVAAKALAKKGVNCNAIIPGNVMEGAPTATAAFCYYGAWCHCWAAWIVISIGKLSLSICTF